MGCCIRKTLLEKINILCTTFVINFYFTNEIKRGSFIAPFAICWLYATSLKVKIVFILIGLHEKKIDDINICRSFLR